MRRVSEKEASPAGGELMRTKASVSETLWTTAWLRASARALLLGAVLTGTAGVALAGGFNQGDLLVTDNGGARVLRIDAIHKNVSVLSPPPGGANLLSFPAGIAIAADGTVYVASQGNSKVIQIDPATGGQTAVPLATGQGPWGLDIDAAGNLFVLAAGSGEIWKLVNPSGALPGGVFSFPVVHDPLLVRAWGLAVQADGTLRIGGDSSGLLLVDPSAGTPSVSVLQPPLQAGMKVVGVSRFNNTTQFGVSGSSCARPLAGIWEVALGGWIPVAANDGTGFGAFSCAFSLLLAPDGTSYVGDVTSPLGSGAHILVVAPGTGTVTNYANIPDAGGLALPAGIAIAPITVPEPGAGASLLAALGALGALVGRRRGAPRSFRAPLAGRV